MKTIFMLLILTICLYPQPGNYTYYKFFDDSIAIEINVFATYNSLFLNNVLTLTEILGIEYWDRMRERGIRFIDKAQDNSFDKQLRRIWKKQER